MEITAVVASTYKDHENGWSYSESALADLAESAPGKPVIYGKKRIGLVKYGRCQDGQVTVTASIDSPEKILNKKLYLVPGGLTDFDTVGDIIDTCAAHQFFFTDRPSDATLTAFEPVD